MTSQIYEEAAALRERLVGVRRDLHRHPELGFRETRTAGIVASELTGLGYEVATGIATTGVIGLLEGGQPGPAVMLRFDMDALPVTEETGAEYASENPGVMHACGHDGHVSIGLAVARLLAARRENLHGTLKLVFQPAEEALGGALEIIAAGALEKPRPETALGLHLWNDLPLGTAAVHGGPLLAGADLFKVRLLGAGGHGALPHQSIDPVLAAAQVVTALQSIPSRNISPLESAVVSVTRMLAGEALNVIPPSAELGGTIRTFEPAVRKRVLKRFDEIVNGVAGAMGCRAEIVVEPLTPPVINDGRIAERLQLCFARDFPDLNIDTAYRTMVSEDMAYFLERTPGVFFLVGSGNPQKGLTFGHHHPRFDFDEDALVLAAALMTDAALACMGT